MHPAQEDVPLNQSPEANQATGDAGWPGNLFDI
jgi:hypothetical protein